MGDKKKGRPAEFARIFDPERFDETLQTKLKEKGDKISAAAMARVALHKDIDLHGYTAYRAEKFLETFFLTARQEGVATVSVITGKGLHSQGGAVLPDLAERKMREFQADGIIISFYWERGSREISGKLTARLRNKTREPSKDKL